MILVPFQTPNTLLLYLPKKQFTSSSSHTGHTISPNSSNSQSSILYTLLPNFPKNHLSSFKIHLQFSSKPPIRLVQPPHPPFLVQSHIPCHSHTFSIYISRMRNSVLPKPHSLHTIHLPLLTKNKI